MTILAAFLAYLVGSIPTGVLLAGLVGVDVRSAGSGNIGATNVARTAGRTLGILTLIGDALKGVLPVALARALDLGTTGTAAVAVAALAGHVFSVFLKFQGGKGVATGVGVLIGLAPAAAPIPLVIFAVVVGVTRIVSLASILAAVAAPVTLALLGYPGPTSLAALAIAVIIVARHGENISRLLAGTEPTFRSKST